MCFANPDLTADLESDEAILDTLYNLKSDPNFSDYLNASVGAINRAFSCLEIKGLSPVKILSLKAEELKYENGFIKLELDALAPDLLRVKRIFSKDQTGIFPIPVSMESENGELFIPPVYYGDIYVEYYKKIPRISHVTADTYEIGLDSTVCSLIPYYVKGDILRVDDPEEAKESMELFFRLAGSISQEKYPPSEGVYSVYKGV